MRLNRVLSFFISPFRQNFMLFTFISGFMGSAVVSSYFYVILIIYNSFLKNNYLQLYFEKSLSLRVLQPNLNNQT